MGDRHRIVAPWIIGLGAFSVTLVFGGQAIFRVWSAFEGQTPAVVNNSLFYAMFAAPVAGILGYVLQRMRLPPQYAPPQCLKCGYDLTGNVSGRCPECGTPIASPPTNTR